MSQRRMLFRELRALRNERRWGKSYREIARLHDLPKSTVFDHTRDVKILKSATKQETPHVRKNQGGEAAPRR